MGKEGRGRVESKKWNRKREKGKEGTEIGKGERGRKKCRTTGTRKGGKEEERNVEEVWREEGGGRVVVLLRPGSIFCYQRRGSDKD